MSAFITDIALAVTTTAVFPATAFEGDAWVFVKNNGADLISLNLYYYPDGVTAVKDPSISLDLSNIAVGASVLTRLASDHIPMISMDGKANSGSQSAHVEVIQSPISRARRKFIDK